MKDPLEKLLADGEPQESLHKAFNENLQELCQRASRPIANTLRTRARAHIRTLRQIEKLEDKSIFVVSLITYLRGTLQTEQDHLERASHYLKTHERLALIARKKHDSSEPNVKTFLNVNIGPHAKKESAELDASLTPASNHFEAESEKLHTEAEAEAEAFIESGAPCTMTGLEAPLSAVRASHEKNPLVEEPRQLQPEQNEATTHTERDSISSTMFSKAPSSQIVDDQTQWPLGQLAGWVAPMNNQYNVDLKIAFDFLGLHNFRLQFIRQTDYYMPGQAAMLDENGNLVGVVNLEPNIWQDMMVYMSEFSCLPNPSHLRTK